MPLDIEWASWPGTLLAIAIALIGVALGLLAFRIVTLVVGRRAPWVRSFYVRIRGRFIVFLTVGALWAVSAVTAPHNESWWPALSHTFLVVQILTGAWLVSAIVTFGITRVMERFDEGSVTAEIRRMRTQLSVVRRLVAVTIAVFAIGAVLFTFPEVQAIGTSILASAGIVSVVAGLAAQSTLGNLIAGIQIAFSDSVRVGDVVVVEGEWGRIGEITLSYVVVYIWDERRLVLPCTYFTTQPFEVWTRRSDRVLGTVYMDLDWRVPMDEVRAKFTEIIEGSDAWDRRSSSVLVTGSQGGLVTVRFVASSANSDDQWTLRCLVREQIMTWLQQEHPEALPTSRVHLEQTALAASSSQ